MSIEADKKAAINKINKDIKTNLNIIKFLKKIKPDTLYEISLHRNCYMSNCTYYLARKTNIVVVGLVTKKRKLLLTVKPLAAKSDNTFILNGREYLPDLAYFKYQNADLRHNESYIDLRAIDYLKEFPVTDLPLLMGWTITNPLLAEKIKE